MLSHYVTMALRSFRRAPFTASINVLALALGLAAFIAAYGVVSYWNQSERHFANADRTYVVTAALAARDGSVRTRGPRTNRLFAEHLRADFPELETIARAQVMNEEGGIAAGDVDTRMFIVGAEKEFLTIFDLPFVKGDPKEALSQPNSIVLSESAATQLFGATDPMGKTVTLGGVLDVSVTGVLGPIPEPSHLGRTPSATLPFDVLTSWDTLDGINTALAAREQRRAAQQGAASNGGPSDRDGAAQGSAPPASDARSGATPPDAPPAGTAPAQSSPPPPENWLGNYCCTTYVMLARDSKLTAKALNAQLRAFGERHLPVQQAQLATLDVGADPVTGLMVTQLDGQLLSAAPGLSITTLLLVLGGLVLVVACVNYANLATARAARRAREVGLRKAIGAGKYRVMAQYLAEAGLLTAAAAALALLAVWLAAPALHNAVGIDLRLGLAENAKFWAFLAGLMAAVTLLGGAYPAFVLSRVPPVEALRIGRTRLGPRFAGTLLVGLQFAAASFLTIVVLVMAAQNRALERTGLGSSSDPIVVLRNFPQFSGIDSALLMAELERIPQVAAVGEAGDTPWSTNVNLIMLAPTPDESAVLAVAYQNNVGNDYFATLGIGVLAGRAFDREHGEDEVKGNLFNQAREVPAVIDESLARQLGFAAPRDAVDKTVYLPERMTRAFGSPAQPVRVLGVVENKPLHLVGAGASANFYLYRGSSNYKLIRLSANDVPGGLAAIDALWKRLAARSPVNRKFMDDLFNQNYENFARLSQAFTGLALVAVVISVIGLTGMAIQVVGRRVHEIGVRKSVGAHTRQIVTMLLTHFSKPVIAANLIAWPLGYLAAQKYLAIFIQRIPLSPLPFLLSVALALAIAWTAVAGQALRAARVSPATVLRSE
jgi:putative ABC transport system permease protein